MSNKVKGVIYALLFGIFGVLTYFCIDNEEEADEFLKGWKMAFIIQLIVAVFFSMLFVGIYLCLC